MRAQSPLDAAARRPDAATIVRLLNRVGYGPRPGDVARVNLALGGTADEAPDRIIMFSLAGDLSASTRQALAGASGPRATAALRTGLVLGAPEFQCR